MGVGMKGGGRTSACAELTPPRGPPGASSESESSSPWNNPPKFTSSVIANVCRIQNGKRC
jgi:hypothetical protein